MTPKFKTAKTLLVEGWRSIAHSYAIVNQFQCLEFVKVPNLKLRHNDTPFLQPSWRQSKGLLCPAAEKVIESIEPLAVGETADALLRISFPYNFAASQAKRTVVFGTAEFRCVPNKYIAKNISLAAACAQSDALIVTPSHWSRAGFIHSGAPADRVVVVPHGVDTTIFHPLPLEQRNLLRKERGLDGFAFLTLGAMNMTKRMDALLKAFAVVVQKHPHCRLIMKGLGALYASQEMLATQSKSLTTAQVASIQPRILYLDNTLTFADMARLYQMADAYVSPYAAEGFNLPVLEAIACGVPVICTSGGSTDDFVRDDFSLRINAQLVPAQQTSDASGFVLEVEFDHLVHQMLSAVENAQLTEAARMHGPDFVTHNFSWRMASDKLLRVLFDDETH